MMVMGLSFDEFEGKGGKDVSQVSPAKARHFIA
jgi:hypothetical protein